MVRAQCGAVRLDWPCPLIALHERSKERSRRSIRDTSAVCAAAYCLKNLRAISISAADAAKASATVFSNSS